MRNIKCFSFCTSVSNHLNISITAAVTAVLAIFTSVLGTVPKYKIHGGSPRENIALQNVQASVGKTLIIYNFPSFTLRWRRKLNANGFCLYCSVILYFCLISVMNNCFGVFSTFRLDKLILPFSLLLRV